METNTKNKLIRAIIVRPKNKVIKINKIMSFSTNLK